MQYCRIISLDNNNSVKFTSSREDNSTINDSMVMKIAQRLCINKVFLRFDLEHVQNCRRKAGDEIVSTDRRADSHGDYSIPPPLRCGGRGVGYKELQATTEMWLLKDFKTQIT